MPLNKDTARKVLATLDWYEHGVYTKNVVFMELVELMVLMGNLIDAGVLLPANGDKPVRMA